MFGKKMFHKKIIKKNALGHEEIWCIERRPIWLESEAQGEIRDRNGPNRGPLRFWFFLLRAMHSFKYYDNSDDDTTITILHNRKLTHRDNIS